VEYAAQAPEADLERDDHTLYPHAGTPPLQEITELADRVLGIYSGQAMGSSKAEAKLPGAQKTLEHSHEVAL